MTTMNLDNTTALTGIEMAAGKLRFVETAMDGQTPFENHLRHAAGSNRDRRDDAIKADEEATRAAQEPTETEKPESATSEDGSEETSEVTDKAKNESTEKTEADEEVPSGEDTEGSESEVEETEVALSGTQAEVTKPATEEVVIVMPEDGRAGEKVPSEDPSVPAEVEKAAAQTDAQGIPVDPTALPGEGTREAETQLATETGESIERGGETQGETAVTATQPTDAQSGGEGAEEASTTEINGENMVLPGAADQQQGENGLAGEEHRTAKRGNVEKRPDQEQDSASPNEQAAEEVMARNTQKSSTTSSLAETIEGTTEKTETKTNEETGKPVAPGVSRTEGDWVHRPTQQRFSPNTEATPVSRETGSETADRARFVQRVAKAFETFGQRSGTVRLRLSPPELGSLRLEVTVRHGMMTARVEADTQEARHVLLDNLPALRDRLTQQNIKIERFDVDYHDPSSGGSPAGTDQRQSSGDGSRRETAVAEVDALHEMESPGELSEPSRTSEGARLNVVI